MVKAMANKTILIIGGGPAGLMAAGQAVINGASAIILEKMSRPCRKLSITGKGRCNLTNTAELREFIEHFGRNGKFLHQAFNRFFSNELQSFFAELGVPLKIERGGRVFPVDDNAPAVAVALIEWAVNLGVEIQTNTRVARLIIENNMVTGVACDDGRVLHGAVIIATGGKSYPATGSTGDGYTLAESVGHTIRPTFPSLVPLETSDTSLKSLDGLNLKNVKATVKIDGKKKESQFGEMTFTDSGISGPIILTLSRDIVRALENKQQVELLIDLKPALDEKKLDTRLIRELSTPANEPFENILKTLLPGRLIPVCLAQLGIPGDNFNHQITAAERHRLLSWLKAFRIPIFGHRSYNDAIVTAGGIAIKEINPHTMESKIIRGLYLAGEVIDIDGDTGGYNLQAAFSTGWLAGRAAAAQVLA